MDGALLVKIAVSRAGQRCGDGSVPATIACRESGGGSVGGGQREATLRELHDRHAGELWRFGMRLTHDRQLSEDVVQEVLLKAWKDPSLGQRDEAAARAWRFTASRSLIIDKWRSAASQHEQRIEEPPEESVGEATSVVLDRWLIAEALTSLSVEHRSVISAAYYDGRSVADISARLRIPEGTVKSRLHYGLRTLRLALQKKGVTRP
jgi:RNA polymerase sigma-70 factor (ECF subfamily)